MIKEDINSSIFIPTPNFCWTVGRCINFDDTQYSTINTSNVCSQCKDIPSTKHQTVIKWSVA